MTANKNSDTIKRDLVGLIFQIESELRSVKEAFVENQKNGEATKDKIEKFKDVGKAIPQNLNDNMRTIMCLREWHWKYIERFERFIFECKSIFLELDKSQSSTGFLVKKRLNKAVSDAKNALTLGQEYLGTLGDVFDGNYFTLIPGEEILNEALKLMSERMQKNNRSR